MKEKKQRGHIPLALRDGHWSKSLTVFVFCHLCCLLHSQAQAGCYHLYFLYSLKLSFGLFLISLFFHFISVPEDHLLWSNRSHAYASEDKYKEAYHDAEVVLKLRPDWPKVRSECLYMYALNLYSTVTHFVCMCGSGLGSTHKRKISFSIRVEFQSQWKPCRS